MISVVTTLFNYQDYIGDAILSFLSQDLKDSEMVIVDDASTDESQSVVNKYLSDRVRYIRLSKNLGYSNAKNVGIKAARGDVLVMLDADDMLVKGSLSSRYRKLREGFDLVHGPALDLDRGITKPSPLWGRWFKLKDGPKAYKGIHAQTVMLRKDVHSRVGLYDTNLRYKSDREMWARVINHGMKVGWVTEPVCIYRIHEKQMHKSKQKAKINEQLETEVQKIIERRATDLSGLAML